MKALIFALLFLLTTNSALELRFSDIKKGAGKQFLAIAQAKVGTSKHPSVPYIIVDAQPSTSGCMGWDWLFNPGCSKSVPKIDLKPAVFNIRRNKAAYIYLFELPSGYNNLRVGFPAFGSCESARLGQATHTSGEGVCATAAYRKRESYRYRPCVTKRVRKKVCKKQCRRRCRRRFLRRKKCWTTCSTPCNYTTVRVPCSYTTRYRYVDCQPTHVVLLVLSQSSKRMLRLSSTGAKYSSFTYCSASEAARLFKAD